MINGLKYYLIAALCVLLGDFIGHGISCLALWELKVYIPYGEHYMVDALIIVCLAERLIDNNKEN